jgi:uncharacterized protein YkwD
MKKFLVVLAVAVNSVVIGQNPVKPLASINVTLTKSILDSISEFQNRPIDELYEASNFLILINQYREYLGVTPLILDTLLCNAAANQAEYMSKTKKCGHIQTTPGFETMIDRIIKFNTNFDKSNSYFAENCLNSVLIDCVFRNRSISELSLDRWANSSGHNRNMINPKFNKIGISFKIVDGMIYATTVFSM